MTCDHGAPVEAILVFPSGAACLTAGDNYIKVPHTVTALLSFSLSSGVGLARGW